MKKLNLLVMSNLKKGGKWIELEFCSASEYLVKKTESIILRLGAWLFLIFKY